MACSGISDATFDVISEDQSDTIWFCWHYRIALPGMNNILKSISQLDKSHTALMGNHDALERRVEVLEERKTEDSSLTMMETIKKDPQHRGTMIEDTTILPPLSNSDHNVISFSLIVEERLSENSTIRIVDYNKEDWEGIRDVLGRVEWDEWITDNATTEENLETFTTILESVCRGIPTRKKTRRKRSVWMNRKV